MHACLGQSGPSSGRSERPSDTIRPLPLAPENPMAEGPPEVCFAPGGRTRVRATLQIKQKTKRDGKLQIPDQQQQVECSVSDVQMPTP